MKNRTIPTKKFLVGQNTEYEAIIFNRFDSIKNPIDFIATVKYEGTPYCLFNAEDGVFAVMKDSNYFLIQGWLEDKYSNTQIEW